jgi:hypothetical protein
MATKIVGLCQDCQHCPVVEVTERDVRIGEKGNLCVLKPDEFATLKRKILAGEL